MDCSTDKMVLCQKWPELEPKELVEFYNEIKLKRKLDLDWVNPGRIDPKLLTVNSSSKENHQMKRDVMTIQGSNDTSFPSKDSQVQNNHHQVENKFNFSDEFLNEEDKKDEENNEIFKIENTALISNKMRRDTNSKKIACFDKIFNDMRKSYEIANKQFDDIQFNMENNASNRDDEAHILNSSNETNLIQHDSVLNDENEKRMEDMNINNNKKMNSSTNDDLFNLDEVNLIHKVNKDETFSDLCNNSDNNNENYLKEQQEFNSISNDTLMARLKEDEEEFINYRKNNFNSLQANNAANNIDDLSIIANESDTNIAIEEQYEEKSGDVTNEDTTNNTTTDNTSNNDTSMNINTSM